jgi:hypothetical protein
VADQTAATEYRLEPEETYTYDYALVESLEDSVCTHMKDVYNREFRQPWNFRAFMRAKYPAAARLHYELGVSRPITEDMQFPWYMRFALYPTSDDFDAVDWGEAVAEFESGVRRPIRLAEFDLKNHDKPVLLVQAGFYGLDSSASDIFYVRESGSLPASQSTYSFEELGQRGVREQFIGDIIRPFIYDGVAYLGQYQSADTDGEHPVRHIPPETMMVKQYIGGQPIGAAMHAKVICKFNMRRTDDEDPSLGDHVGR